jgi:hypothetical protein
VLLRPDSISQRLIVRHEAESGGADGFWPQVRGPFVTTPDRVDGHICSGSTSGEMTLRWEPYSRSRSASARLAISGLGFASGSPPLWRKRSAREMMLSARSSGVSGGL